MRFSGEEVSEVPEPTTLAIFALGIMGLASRRLKKLS
ncbi:MAG: PEP-CTERM sorting domain-containing protein [Thalassotalea sp.]|nr:PEP-CTERM sorting domain-containing protein [Thalassotalea sp.]MDG2394279.1 PEP-CTERM sorting domain-containing protein [Thalassotalea sp.]